MRQIDPNANGLKVVPVDYHSEELAPQIRELQPLVYIEENENTGQFAGYCCLLGMDPTEGIFGCGNTPQAAMSDWLATLRSRISALHDSGQAENSGQQGDEVAQYALDVLRGSKNDIW